MIQIGVWRFRTKHAAEARILEILAAHDHGQRVRDVDDQFIRALLDLHPNQRTIVDCGIAWIYVENRDGGKGFSVRHTDGSPFDFSWRDAIYQTGKFTKLSGICRHLIHAQIREFRDRKFRGVCEVCGKEIRRDACHVDHIAPLTFQALLAGWLRSVHLDAHDIAIIPNPNYGGHSRLEDEFLAESWIEYHAINARLRCVCKHCNLSTLRTSPSNVHSHGTY